MYLAIKEITDLEEAVSQSGTVIVKWNGTLMNVGELFAMAAQRMESPQRMRGRARKAAKPRSGMEIMLHLYKKPMTCVQLYETTKATQRRTSVNLSYLKRQGYVTRDNVPNNAVWSLTASGRKRVEEYNNGAA